MARKKNLWQRMPWQLQAGIIGVGVTGGAIIGVRNWKKWKRQVELKKMQQLYQQTNVPVYTTVTAANGVTGFQQSSVNLASVSDTIFDAFYNNDWFGATEDEKKAADALATVPKAYLNQLADVYAQAYKKNLRQDFVKFVSDNPVEWAKVKDYFS
jgi:hypothetical protein